MKRILQPGGCLDDRAARRDVRENLIFEEITPRKIQ